MDITPTDWEKAQAEFDRVAKMFAEKEGQPGRDCQQIGSCLPSLPSLPEPKDSTLPTPPPDLPTTGMQSQVPEAAKPIGTQLSVIGAGDLVTIEQAWHEQDSDKLESSLHRSLKPLRTSSLQSVTDSDFNLLGYKCIGPIDESTRLLLADLAARICEPSTGEHITGCAARCLAMTKSRDPGGLDVRAMLAGFVDGLAEFPPDAVATAFRKHARMEKWWPSLSEIRDHCQRATRWRHSLRKVLS